MIRVFFYAGAAILLCSATLMFLPTCFSFVLGGVCFFAALFILLFWRKCFGVRSAVCLLIVAVFCFYGVLNYAFNVQPAKQLSGFSARVVGTVTDYPTVAENYISYPLKIESLTLKQTAEKSLPTKFSKSLTVIVTDSQKQPVQVFDRVELDLTFNALQGSKKTSSYASGVYAGGSVQSSVTVKGKNRPFYAVFYDLRQTVEKAFYSHFTKETANFSSALLLGNKNAIDAEFSTKVRLTGVSHVLVVSGMHLGILFQFFDFLFSLLRCSKRVGGFLQLGIIFAFSAVCGFSPSVLRAGFTYAVIALGRILIRRPDALNSLGFAAVVSCFLNPFLCCNVGAMLSFAATLGLLVGCPAVIRIFSLPFKKGMPRVVKPILFSFAQTITASFFTFPITVAVFGYLSIVSPLTNLLISHAATLLLCLLLFTVPLLFLPSFFTPLRVVSVFLCEKVTSYIMAVISFLSKPKGIVLNAEKELLWPYFFLLLAFGIGALWPRLKKHALRVLAGVLAALFFCCSAASTSLILYFKPAVTVQVLRLGYGFSAVITTSDLTVIVGAGDSNAQCSNMVNAMLKAGRTAGNVLILPNLNRSMAKGAAAFIKMQKVETVLHPNSGSCYEEIVALNPLQNTSVFSFTQCTEYRYGQNQTAICLADCGVVFNTSDCSVLVLTNSAGLFSLNRLATAKNKILVCHGQLPISMQPEEYSKIIVSCATAQKAALEQLALSANYTNIKYNDLETQTVKWRKNYVE